MSEEAKEPSEGNGRSGDSGVEKPSSGARDRVESLTAKPSGEKDRGSGSGKSRPVLTEKQRREARLRRQAERGRKPARGGNPLSKGMRATAAEIRRTAAFLGNGVIAALAALGPVFSAAGMGLVWLLDRAGQVLKALANAAVRALAALGRGVLAVERIVTPRWGLILVGAVAAVLLGVSQFKGLGAIEIGQAGYAGIEDLARAPATDKTTPAGVHTRILVPIAALTLLAVVVIALGSVGAYARRFARFRRFASMVLVAVGLLTLAVALLVDLPDATDTSDAAALYVGAEARLLAGFWLELAAGATLVVAGLGLLFEPAAGRVKLKQHRPESRTDEERRQDRAARRLSRDQVVNGGRA